jgi:type II secretory pathway pseudopilin PulG
MTHAKNKGYLLLMSLIFLAIFFVILSTMVSSLVSYTAVTNHAVASSQALELAEGAIDKAIYQLNQNPNYAGESNTALGSGTFSVSVSTIDSGTKSVLATAYIPNSTNPITTRAIRVNTNIGQSVISFHYGVQVGSGGFNMTGGSVVNGSIYSNGSIIVTNGSKITGAAVAANPPALSADQTNDTPTPISSCTASTCITFATTTATEDFAQSFKISSAVQLNNIQFYIKKVGTPGDATVRIVADAAGSPGATTILSGTLPAASVTTSFGWVSVTMPTSPILDPSQTYWMVIDGSSNSSRYYIIGANSGGYPTGQAKIGRFSTGVWTATSPSGLDGYFKVYLGGGTSTVGGGTYVGSGIIGTTASDDAWAHTVQGTTVTGTIYCQTGSLNNKACDTTRSDPPAQPMPFSDSNVQEWKDDAVAGTTINGAYTVNSAGATIGPAKINGDLLINGGGTLTLTGTVWVTGNVTVTSGGKVKLASSYGANSGALISDGYVVLNGGTTFSGSGTAGSYPFLITTSACPAASGCGGNSAISLSGGTGTVALVAQNGNVQIDGGSSLKQVTGKQVILSGGATLYYDSGLISENFMSGPGGSWVFIPGTYSIVQ